jgi:hypothetical protein
MYQSCRPGPDNDIAPLLAVLEIAHGTTVLRLSSSVSVRAILIAFLVEVGVTLSVPTEYGLT